MLEIIFQMSSTNPASVCKFSLHNYTKTVIKKIGTSTAQCSPNFLDAFDITGASKKIKRVILTTGTKQYGVHLGCLKQPMEDWDRWSGGGGRPPNFYFHQQRILADKAKESNNKWDWVVTLPQRRHRRRQGQLH